MKTKTAEQIERMKEQTIGVEVEMNNIRRAYAAKIASYFFGTFRYEDTENRNGYSTWSAWDNKGREWKFQKDVSIEGPSEQKCELVTPILKYEDIPTLQGLIRALRKAGAKSSASQGCGVHIHIGANGHDAQSLRRLANIMASHEDLLIHSIKIATDRTRNYCQTVDKNFLNELNKRKPTSMTALANIWYRSQNCNYNRDGHYNNSRYHQLNLHAVFTKGTIEFRLFQFDEETGARKGGLHAGQLKAYIQLCLALSEMAKSSKAASPKPQQNENEKFAMRTWLIRLGFVGEEFATAREMLTKNLTGDTAFRYGRNA